MPPGGPVLELEQVHVDDAHVRAMAGRCAIIIWRGTMTLDRWAAMVAMVTAREAIVDGRFAWISVIEASVPVPTAEVRETIANSGKGREDRTAVIAVAQEGAGLRGVLVRTVVTAMSLVGPASFKPEVFSSVDELAVVVAKRLAEAGHPTTSALIVDAIARLRAKFR